MTLLQWHELHFTKQFSSKFICTEEVKRDQLTATGGFMNQH